MSDSNFQILDIGNMAASARGIMQDISPIPNGRVRTKMSGRSYSTARPQFEKFKTTIQFQDLWPPAIGRLRVGQVVTIHCAVLLPQRALVGSTPVRPPVPDTLVYYDEDMNPVPEGDPSAKWFNCCPILTAIVEGWNISEDEWGAVSSSDITFTEQKPFGWIDPNA